MTNLPFRRQWISHLHLIEGQPSYPECSSEGPRQQCQAERGTLVLLPCCDSSVEPSSNAGALVSVGSRTFSRTGVRGRPPRHCSDDRHGNSTETGLHEISLDTWSTYHYNSHTYYFDAPDQRWSRNQNRVASSGENENPKRKRSRNLNMLN